ncbi:hypothetical protein SAMN06265375_101445 [Muriicola jejuensis]|nr:hypothetical protein SAMN06265375_101445 [Muriicola jejuensis]
MEYLVFYLVSGLFVSIVISEIYKIKLDEEDKAILSNIDRVLYIIIWPLMIYWIIKGLFTES